MKKILMATKCTHDMTSFLRAWGVFTHPTMKSIAEPVRFPVNEDWIKDWSYYWNCDLVYLHRPSNQMDIMIMERARFLGIPVWVDHDDDLEKITSDNPVFKDYDKPDVREAIRYSIENADVLSVGGEAHAKRIREEFGRETHLIPNALDDRLLHLKKPFKMNKKIAWRGSESHRTDLIYYSEEIIEAMKKFEREWVFFGQNPYFLDWDEGSRYKWVKPLSVMEFYNAITSYNAALHMHPMIDSEFNRVKSNLCYTDAVLAGSVIIAPNFEEYRRPGVILFKGSDRKDFARCLDDALEMSDYTLETLHKQSWDWIRDNILMSKVNNQRLEILRNI